MRRTYPHKSAKFYKELGPVSYRQWRADSHCNKLHGYALSFEFKFEAADLDARNWVQDFGGLADLRSFLKDQFDHTLLVALDDPEIDTFIDLEKKGLVTIRYFDALGCEALAKSLHEYMNGIYLPSFGKSESERVWCYEVVVRETEANYGSYVKHRED